MTATGTDSANCLAAVHNPDLTMGGPDTNVFVVVVRDPAGDRYGLLRGHVCGDTPAPFVLAPARRRVSVAQSQRLRSPCFPLLPRVLPCIPLAPWPLAVSTAAES